MPQDIFISYSSKDKEKADQLSELLASAGLSVWIDQSGIEVAASWSKEIVQAIDSCKAFVVLLSTNSILSHNVIKEVSLAAEQKKKILPLDLEPVMLPEELRYHLAGIQRAPMTNIDAIIRAIGKLGLHATHAPMMRLVHEPDSRKSLMILPFEDLSPTGDNGWFADGLGAELISALSTVTSLRVIDQQTTKEFKNFKGNLTTYATEMSVRYFIQGSVRKFGDQIKIASSLLDIETGEHLWQDSLKGTMDDIFDIQEKVAEKVVEGLKIHLASNEKKKLSERGTLNAESYELFMKAQEYFDRQTKEGIILAIQMLTESIHLDHNFARAYQHKANALVSLYRSYDRKPSLLDEAETLCKEAIKLKPDLFFVNKPLSQIYLYRGRLAEAEEIAVELTLKDPMNFNSHFALGFFFVESGQTAKAIAPYEEAARLKPGDLKTLWNLVVSSDSVGEKEKCKHWALVALPYLERQLKLNPDDESMRVMHGLLLICSGRLEDAQEVAMKLSDLKDGNSLYNAACLFGRLGDLKSALRTFRAAIEAGLRDMRALNEFLTGEREGVAALAGTPEYEEVKAMVDTLSNKN